MSRARTLLTRARRTLAWLALFGTLAAAVGTGARPVVASANLLANPGFDDPYSTWGGVGEFQVAYGWNPWYSPSPPPGFDPFLYHRPEFKNAAPFENRLHSGCCAQQYFTFYSTHEAGLYQQVSVTPGSRLRFSAYAQVWSSNYDDPNQSREDGYITLRVGIDPAGGTSPTAGSIVWSAYLESYDNWSWLAVEATAASSTVTVFIYSIAHWPVKHNNVYWDDAALEVVGTGGTNPAPSPAPTATPAPTTTPVATPSSQAGASQATYTVQRGDRLTTIARQSGTTWQALAALNNLVDPNLIYVGQVLTLPGAAAGASETPAPPSSTPAPTASSGAGGAPTAGKATLYAVRSGDNLHHIARRFGTTVERLMQLNALRDPDLLYVGQLLSLPPEAASLPELVIYTVQPGDTLSAIARRSGAAVSAIISANGLKTTTIYVGQDLIIP